MNKMNKMNKTTLLTLSAIALSAISAGAATVTVDDHNNSFGDVDAFAIDFDATTGGTADWTPDLSTSNTYSIDSISVWEQGTQDTDFYLGVYTGFTGGTLSGFQGASTNTINFSDETGTFKVTWDFIGQGITVTPEVTPGSGGDQRYFVFQTVATAQTTLVDLGDNTTTLAIFRNGSYADRLSGVIKAGDTSVRGNRNQSYEATLTAIPEPSSAALLGLGGLALILRRRK